MSVAALLLAAGESARMGAPKPLLQWQGTTLIEYQVEQLRSAADLVVVVLGHRANEIRPQIERGGAEIVVNQSYVDGRASSVRTGSAALPEDMKAIIVLNVDQPRPAWLLRRLVDEKLATQSTIAVPSHRGKRGHPPVFDGTLLGELREVRDEDLGLRAVLERHADDVAEVEFDSEIVLLDLNERGEYERALAQYGTAVGGEAYT